MDFTTFKQLYGHKEKGVRLVKVGNEILRVDNEKFTYSVLKNKANEQKRKFMLSKLFNKQGQNGKRQDALRNIPD